MVLAHPRDKRRPVAPQERLQGVADLRHGGGFDRAKAFLLSVEILVGGPDVGLRALRFRRTVRARRARELRLRKRDIGSTWPSRRH
jgi:hypothetical protein